TRIEFDYLKHNVNIIYHYYSYRLRPDDAGLERLLSAIDERNAWLEELDKNRRSRPTYRYLRIDQLKGSSEPFNWDTAKIRSGELPGAIKPTDPAFAIRAAGTVTLQDKAWDNAPAYHLQPNRGEKELKETTTFQLLYDKDNLYVRFDGGMQSELMDTFSSTHGWFPAPGGSPVRTRPVGTCSTWSRAATSPPTAPSRRPRCAPATRRRTIDPHQAGSGRSIQTGEVQAMPGHASGCWTIRA
ncbi:MAG: hypothetical protein ABR497_02125, partial [Kiritimatiellia bacterium]